MTTRRTFLSSTLAVPIVALAGNAAAQEATPVVQSEMGVVYGDVDGTELLLDVYRPGNRGAPQPAVVLFHPGGMVEGDRTILTEHAQALAQAGYVAFNVDYRLLGPDGSNTWPAQLDDAQRAVRWVRANAEQYGADAERVASYGPSAGATLATQLGVRDTRDNADPTLKDFSGRVTCVVDLVGEVDLTIPPPNPDDVARRAALLGGTREEVPDAYRDVSAVTFVDEYTVPFLIFHSPADTTVPIEHARRLSETLHRVDAEVVYAELANIDHREWTWADIGPWMLAFLERQLQPGV
jgi:acetyl esterase/lipase